MSARFYCPDLPNEGACRLDPEESRHLSQVCRAKVGDEVELFDGRGRSVAARVVAIGRNVVELATVGEGRTETPMPVEISLAIAVPKGDRFDWLVEKATEIGISRLVPIQTTRGVVEPRSTKIDRLRRTVVEASKQSGRARLMVLEEPTPWPKIAECDSEGPRLIAHPGGRSCRDWPRIAEGSELTLAIGPEGGFTDEEVESAVERGWIPVSLGPTILRIETAAIVGASAIFARLEARAAKESN